MCGTSPWLRPGRALGMQRSPGRQGAKKKRHTAAEQSTNRGDVAHDNLGRQAIPNTSLAAYPASGT